MQPMSEFYMVGASCVFYWFVFYCLCILLLVYLLLMVFNFYQYLCILLFYCFFTAVKGSGVQLQLIWLPF